jgi:hypothetical protein
MSDYLKLWKVFNGLSLNFTICENIFKGLQKKKIIFANKNPKGNSQETF